jgi:hypothetical protein
MGCGTLRMGKCEYHGENKKFDIVATSSYNTNQSFLSSSILFGYTRIDFADSVSCKNMVQYNESLPFRGLYWGIGLDYGNNFRRVPKLTFLTNLSLNKKSKEVWSPILAGDFYFDSNTNNLLGMAYIGIRYRFINAQIGFSHPHIVPNHLGSINFKLQFILGYNLNKTMF